MNLLAVLCVFILYNRAGYSFIDIDTVSFIEYDFCSAFQNQVKADKGFLVKVKTILESNNIKFYKHFCSWKRVFYYDKINNLNYEIIDNETARDIALLANSFDENKKFITIKFCFSPKEIESYAEYRENKEIGNLHVFKSFRALKKTPNSVIAITDDEIESRKYHVLERFDSMLASNLLQLNKKFNNGTIKISETDLVFDLHYFENLYCCFENLKLLLKPLCQFILVDDISSTNHNADFDDQTTLSLTTFIDHLEKIFDENFRFFVNRESSKYIKRRTKCSFNDVCRYLIDCLLNKKIYLPLGGKYDIKYHIERLYTMIDYSVETYLQNHNVHYQNTSFKNESALDIFDNCLAEESEVITLKDVLGQENLLRHFSELIKKDITDLKDHIDYIEIEKIVCDYYNMLQWLTIRHDVQCVKHDITFTAPILINNYKLRIAKSIKIRSKWPINLGEIKAYNRKGSEIEIKKDIDYFIKPLGDVYLFSDKIIEKNIYEIEIVSNEEKNTERFIVEEYLSG